MFTLNCRGKIIKIEIPLVMGIINATPDSFYEGHLGMQPGDIVALAKRMIAEGVSILDIGAQSSRPGSERISAEAELQRLMPIINAIRSACPGILISVDTYYSVVASAAAEAGADMINDISSGDMDTLMIPTVASLKLPLICMHMKGTPKTMHEAPVYDDVVKEVLDYFITKTAECRNAGIKDLIIDPGFGFGKTIRHNFTLLKQLSIFKMLELPILAGLSRKSTIYKTLGSTPQEALNGTTVLNTIALQNGASILRVHDVREAVEAVTLLEAYHKSAAVDE